MYIWFLFPHITILNFRMRYCCRLAFTRTRTRAHSYANIDYALQLTKGHTAFFPVQYRRLVGIRYLVYCFLSRRVAEMLSTEFYYLLNFAFEYLLQPLYCSFIFSPVFFLLLNVFVFLTTYLYFFLSSFFILLYMYFFHFFLHYHSLERSFLFLLPFYGAIHFNSSSIVS